MKRQDRQPDKTGSSSGIASKGKGSSLSRKLLLALGGLIVGFAIAEWATRAWLYGVADDYTYSQIALYEDVPQQHRMFSPHHYLNYYNTPGFVSRDGLNRHNALGFRGEEIAVPKPAGRFRIAVLGGSGTYTIKVPDYRQSFPAQLEKQLREQYGRSNVEVINAGVGGYNSWETLINLQFRVLDLQPDLVIFYDAINDVHARIVPPDAYRGDNSGERRQWQTPRRALWERSILLRLLNQRLRLAPMRYVGLEGYVNTDSSYLNLWSQSPEMVKLIDANPPTFFRRNIYNMIAVAREQKVGFVLSTWAHSPNQPGPGEYVTWPQYAKGAAEHNAILKAVAAERKVPLLDLAAVMPQDAQYWFDGRHVNEAGAQKKAEFFAKFLTDQNLIPK
jgi:lysophospholipase L1-like esterase